MKKIAIRENDLFPETMWADWIKNYSEDMGVPYITEEPYNYQILEVSDDIDLSALVYDDFDCLDGTYSFNQPRYEQRMKEFQNKELSARYIPSETQSMKAFAKAYLAANPLQSDEEKLLVSGLIEEWAPGNYKVGDVRNHAGQTWECHQAHDNAVYPDINPDNPSTWATFWRPLHGKSEETARPWVKPCAGTTDMYHAGEYMVYTDGKIYRCKSDTVYSPEEYAQAWEVVA